MQRFRDKLAEILSMFAIEWVASKEWREIYHTAEMDLDTRQEMADARIAALEGRIHQTIGCLRARASLAWASDSRQRTQDALHKEADALGRFLQGEDA